MTSTLKISLKDLTHQMLLELQEQFGQSAELEIKLKDNTTGKPLFDDADFWLIISQLDWSKNDSDDVFKYGISSDPIEEDGLSRRIKVQLRLLNVIDGWKRFLARILIKNIADRPTAKKIEQEHIKKYEDKNGRRPRGNL